MIETAQDNAPTAPTLADTAIAELNLPNTARLAVYLADVFPQREHFAGEILAASLNGPNADQSRNQILFRRLNTLAGTHRQSQNLLARLRHEYAATEKALSAMLPPKDPTPQPGPAAWQQAATDTLATLTADHGKLDDTNAYQVAGPAGRAGPAAAPPGSQGPEQSPVAGSAVTPQGKTHGEQGAITNTWDMMRRIVDGKQDVSRFINGLEQGGWITPQQADLGRRLQAYMSGRHGASFRENAQKLDAELGSLNSDALRAAAVERLLANTEAGMDAETAVKTSLAEAKEQIGYSAGDLLVDGAQGSVPGLAFRDTMPDRLTDKQRANMSPVDKLIHSIGQIAGDTPTLAMGGGLGSLAGPGGTLAGAIGLTEGMRAYYIDAIRNGEITSFDDVLRRAESTGWGVFEGTVAGVGGGYGAKFGTELAKKAGLEIGGTMMAAASGEVAGLTTAAAALRGEFPSLEEFQHNAALIVGMRGMGKAGQAGKEALTQRLESFWAATGVKPDAVSQAAKNDPAVAQYLHNPKQPMPETLANEVQRAVIYNDSRSVKMTFRETGVDPSITVRPELREYVNSLNGEEMAAMKAKDPAQYLATLRGITRKLFPKGGSLKYRTENGRFDYEHLLTDETRSMFIHTLPRTLKDYDIKVEFETKDDVAKAYLIKKYFEPTIQKDIWDVLVFQNAELKTKMARKTMKGRGYVESIITGAENK